MAFFGRPPVLAGRSGLRFVSLSASFLAAFWPASDSFYAWMTCRMEYKNRFVFCDVFFWLKLFFFLKKVFYVEESFLEKPFSRNMNVKPAD